MCLELFIKSLPEDIFAMIKDNVRDLEIIEKHKNKMKKVHKDLIEEYNYLREENILHEYLNLSESYDSEFIYCHNEGIDPVYDNDTFNALQRLVDFHKKYLKDIMNIKKRYTDTRVGDMIESVFLNIEDYNSMWNESLLF